jgi:hypothetical protein
LSDQREAARNIRERFGVNKPDRGEILNMIGASDRAAGW